jgi:hypothetical protein
MTIFFSDSISLIRRDGLLAGRPFSVQTSLKLHFHSDSAVSVEPESFEKCLKKAVSVSQSIFLPYFPLIASFLHHFLLFLFSSSPTPRRIGD